MSGLFLALEFSSDQAPWSADRDPELLHAGVQGVGMEVEDLGCTAGACELTTGGRREGLSDGIMLSFEPPRAW